MKSGTTLGAGLDHLHQQLQKSGFCSRRRPGLVARRQARATQVILPPVHCATSSHFSQQQGEQAQQPSILPSKTSLSFDAVVSPSSSSPQRQHRQQFRHAFASLTSDSLDSWDFDDHHPSLPGPSNTPTNEDDDVEELLYAPRREIDMWTLTDQPGIDLLLAGPGTLEHLQQVYVILFGVGERDTEGIYSLRAFGDDGLPQETIIVFEIEEDAQRYAGLLEATMDHTPNVCSIPPRELLDFCVDQGYHCRMEPCGSLLIPPDFNVGVTDWERSMRLRDGRWEVLDTEPEHAPTTASPSSSNTLTTPSSSSNTPVQTGVTPAAHLHHHLPHARSGVPMSHASLARYHPSFSDSQLQQIRERLESLLPQQDNSSSGGGKEA